MLKPHGERLFLELPHYVKSSIGILYVIVRKLFPVKLASGSQGIRGRFQGLVELGALVRVFPVAEMLAFVIFQEQLFRKAGFRTHPGSYRDVIFRSVGICLRGEFQTCFPGSVAVSFQFVQHRGVILGIDHYGH